MNKILQREMLLPLIMIAGIVGGAGTVRAAESSGQPGRCNAAAQIASKNAGKGGITALHRVGCQDPAGADEGGGSGSGSATIGPDGGKVLSTDGMAELFVPAGALSASLEISVRAVSYPDGEKLEFVTAAYDFQPDGLTFAVPATLTLHYDPSRLPRGATENLMNVYFQHTDTGKWEGLYGKADTATHTVTANVPHFTTFSGAPDRHILIYAISNRTDSTAFGTMWYKDPSDFSKLIGDLSSAGFNRMDARDEVDLPELDATTISRYRQVWVLEGDGDATIDVTAAERDLLLQYYSFGRSVWISGENNMNQTFLGLGGETNLYWYEDTNFLMQGFGVDNPGTMILTNDVTYTYAAHPLFNKIDWISFNGETGRLTTTNPALQWVVTYVNQFDGPDAPAGKYTGMGVLDEKGKGAGRAVFDAGWVLGYSYFRLHAGDDNPAFCVNMANFLAN
ncbi:MAG: hypothetical protein HYT87_10370 [Nitrospirae bacterium]|nr:hypothetical protein [Nitrospirota bacterium]